MSQENTNPGDDCNKGSGVTITCGGGLQCCA